MASKIDSEKTKNTIALILDKINTEADPWLLNDYHRLFKKEVSLFHRSKAAAYLLMLYDQGKDLLSTENSSPDSRNDAQRYPLTGEESKRLFFSVGRSRRVFPREILGLINTKAAVSKEDIGVIRILDNYSFVQVRDNAAERIIEALNGINFRGRPLTVNYAKSRQDEEENTMQDLDPPDNYDSSEQRQNHPEKEDI